MKTLLSLFCVFSFLAVAADRMTVNGNVRFDKKDVPFSYDLKGACKFGDLTCEIFEGPAFSAVIIKNSPILIMYVWLLNERPSAQNPNLTMRQWFNEAIAKGEKTVFLDKDKYIEVNLSKCSNNQSALILINYKSADGEFFSNTQCSDFTIKNKL